MAPERTDNTAEQQARILHNTLRKNDDVSQNGLTLSNAALDSMIGSGYLVARKPEELSSLAEYQISSQLQDKNITERPPVYVVVGQDTKSQDIPQSRLWTTTEGKSVILVNEAAQKEWTPDYVDSHIRGSDQDLQNLVSSKAVIKAQDFLAALDDTPEHKALKENIGQVLADTVAAAGRMEVSPPPEIYIDKTGGLTYHGAPIATSTTKEGHNYVFINEKTLLELSNPEAVKKFETMDDHEVAHIALGHNKSINVARSFHDDAKSRLMELQADLFGSSKVGTGDPETTAKIFIDMGVKNIPRYEATHPNDPAPASLTAQYLHKVSDWMAEGDPTHPPIWDRIVAEKILQMEMGKQSADGNLSPVDRAKHLSDIVIEQMSNPQEAARQFDMVADEIRKANNTPVATGTTKNISK